ncbi:acyl carrier protein [Marinobacter koreensis]|uniref:Acyl carrier protein n=1 Tax=Marinobacter koreensis TaxID=335974 RepID=A0ABW0RIZ8_9GAMM|nr:acyl carrier protein [Marinobacter koreensis]MCK7547018.1 acyl carrier protein [Marinobacter koreensis]
MNEFELKTYSGEPILRVVCKALESRGPLPSDNDITNYDYIAGGLVDSLSLLGFIVGLEETFNIAFSDSDFDSAEFRTVGGLANLIARKRSLEPE